MNTLETLATRIVAKLTDDEIEEIIGSHLADIGRAFLAAARDAKRDSVEADSRRELARGR